MMYGIKLSPDLEGKTAGDYLSDSFHRVPVVGDRVRFDGLDLVVREIDHGKIVRIGLKLSR